MLRASFALTARNCTTEARVRGTTGTLHEALTTARRFLADLVLNLFDTHAPASRRLPQEDIARLNSGPCPPRRTARQPGVSWETVKRGPPGHALQPWPGSPNVNRHEDWALPRFP